MLLFLCAADAEYEHVQAAGLSHREEGHILARTWASVGDCADKQLVVELSADDLRMCTVRDDVVIAKEVPADRFQNVLPYAEVIPTIAAGGLLVRSHGGEIQVLMIHRRGVWDLPKGKLDPGESIEECALREVQEELGIESADIVCAADQTLHGYRERGRYFLKTTYWYVMRTSATQFKPQITEGIDAVRWTSWRDAMDCVGYDTLRELLASTWPTAEAHARGRVAG